MDRLRGIVLLVLILAVPGLASADPITLTFTELPFQPVNGLTFQGVTFGFTIGGVPSTDAHYNSFGPGSITFVQDPSLEGNAAGVLQLDFATATSLLQFGVALSCFGCTLTPGFTLALFDSSLNSLGVFPVNTSPLVSFTENQFTLSGPEVGRAVISFNSSQASRFALDNLTFEPVPEPATLTLFGSGLAAIAALRRRRKGKSI